MRRLAAIILVVVALVAACAVILIDDDESEDQDETVNAGFSAKVTYSQDGATVTLTPKSSGSHVWTVDGDEYRTDGKDALVCACGFSDAPLAVSHTVTLDGDTRSMSMYLDVSGIKTVDLTWTDSQGVARTIELGLSWPDYLVYRDGPVKDPADVLGSDDHAVDVLAAELSTIWAGLGNDDLAAELLLFVQTAFAYQDDFQSAGVAEWVKTPYETVFDAGGDCEDTALLYAMLGRALGLDTVLVEMDGHMAAAVRMDACVGQSYEVDGATFYYCETATDTAIPIGTDVLRAEFVRIIARRPERTHQAAGGPRRRPNSRTSCGR